MKTKKILIPVLLASVLGTGAIASESYVRDVFVEAAYQATSVSATMGDDLKLAGFVSNAEVGEEYTLPTATAGNGGTTITLNVLNPRGVYEVKDAVITSGTNGYTGNEQGKLQLQYSGVYTLYYTAKNSQGMTTNSEQLTINVTSSNYEIVKPTNTQYVIPSTIHVNQENLKIEVPTVKKGDEEQTLFTVEEGEVVANASADTSLEIVLEDKDGEKTPLLDSATSKPEVDANGKFYVAVPSSLLVKQGTYIIHYKYYEGKDSDTRVIKDTETTRFTTSNNLDTDKIQLQMSYNSSLPTATSIVLGEENTLPTVTVKDKTSGSTMNAYTTIKIDYKERNASGYTTLGTIDTFDTDLFTKAGDYRITYTVNLDLFGLEPVTNSFRIDNVTDNKKPELYVVSGYTLNEANKDQYEHLTDEEIDELLTQVEYDIPSTVVLDGESNAANITLPAIYARDNMTNSSELIYKIDYRKSSNNTRKTIYNSTNTESTHKYNETLAFNEIKEAGEYTIIYSVEDQNGNVTERSFTVQVYQAGDSEYTDKVQKATPSVSLTLSKDYIDANADLVFDKPTAKDSYDARVKLETYYLLNDDPTQRELTVNTDGQYVIEKDVLATARKVTVVVNATNDQGNTKTVKRVINVLNGQNAGNELGFDLTTANSYLDNLYTLNNTTESDGIDQGQNVKLPAMTVEDTLGNNLSLEIVVRDKNNNITTVFNGYSASSNDGVTKVTMLEGAYFKATYAGEYTITYIAKNNGNYLAKSYKVTINNTQLPELVLSNIDSLSTSIQVNQAYYPEKARLSEDGVDIPLKGEDDSSQATTSWAIYQAQKPEYLTSLANYVQEVYGTSSNLEQYQAEYDQAVSNWEQANKVLTYTLIMGEDGTPAGFIPKESGVYYIEYTGQRSADSEKVTKIVSVKAEDKSVPTITLDSGYQEYYNAFKADDEKDTMKIELPGFTVTDPYEQDYDSLVASKKVTVVNSDGDNFEVTQAEDGSYYFFATKDDSYTVSYNAKDTNGNAAETVKLTIYIGDYEDPTLTFTDTKTQEKYIPSTVKLNEKFTLDTADLVQFLYDNRTDAENIKVTAVLRNSSNTSLTNELESENSASDVTVKNKYSYTLDKVGTYTLTLTVKDEVGNSKQYTYTINCTEDTEGNVNVVGTVVGTVLIVLSLGLLAGVIIYFAVTGKKGKKSSKKSKTSKK